MAINKEIKINIADTPLKAFRQEIEGLARSATRLNDDIVQKIQGQVKEMRELVDLYIKRNELQRDFSQMLSDQQRALPPGPTEPMAISQPSYLLAPTTTALATQRQASPSDKLMLATLRNIDQSIVKTSENEIRVAKAIDSENDTERRALRDREDIIDVDYQEVPPEVPPAPPTDDDDPNKKKGKPGGGRRRSLASVAGAQTQFHAIAAGVGLFSAGAGVLANRLLNSADRFERALADRARLAGTSIEAEAGRVQEFQDISGRIGLSGGAQAAMSAQMQRAFMGRVSNTQAVNLIAAQTRFGLAPEQINELLGVSRYDPNATPGRTGADAVISTFERYLSRTDQSIAVLPEVLRTYAGLSQNILTNISNQINQGEIAGNIAGIGAATGQTGLGLQATTSAIQGLSASQNPVVRSLMLRSFSQQNPNASLFDMQAMMENPLGNLEATQNFFSSVKNMTGGGEMYKQALYSVFGGQLSRTRINEILETGGDFTEIAKEAKDFAGIKPEDYTKRIEDFVGIIQQANANLETKFEAWGEKTVQKLDEILIKIGDLLGVDKDGKTKLEKWAEQMQKARIESLKKQSKVTVTGTYLNDFS